MMALFQRLRKKFGAHGGVVSEIKKDNWRIGWCCFRD